MGGEESEAAAVLLARATSRPHGHVGLSELAGAIGRHAGEPIALVGLVDDFAALGDWPGYLAPRLGVVSARDASSLSCLVYRTLTLHALGQARDFTILHPEDEEAEDADAVAWDELASLKDGPVRLLAMRTHGMECSANLPDGILCGRSDYLGKPLPVLHGEHRAVSCLRGAGCYRKDLKDEQRLPVADLDASVVFAQSCMSVAVGNNVFPGDVGFGLGFLAGTAVAVIGTIGKHLDDASFMHEMRAGLADGGSLGDVLERVNEQAAIVGGEMSRFGLLGDPTLVLSRDAAPKPLRRPGFPDKGDKRVLDELARINGEIIPRLLRLRWLDVEVPEGRLAELRSEIKAAAGSRRAAPPETELAAAAGQLATIQAEVVTSLVQQIHSSWWHFTQTALPAFGKVGDEPRRCPKCKLDSAFLARFAHRIEPDLSISTIQCRRCGDLWWSTAGSTAALETEHVAWLRPGEPLELTATLSNRAGRRLVGTVGFAISAGKFLHLQEGWSAQCDLDPGESRDIAWTVTAAPEVVPHEYEGWCVQLFDGVYSASTMQMEVLP
ncbi:hypothetical protein MTP10_35795 [Nonomuraea sp. 3-1Str]|uniref:COG1470 family protein n=1 Tax=Nonomuraea sp. 3-1Str TaxID=2929801 RepID=UPI002861DB3B|nr:hypothetical protein [Nonomuraea sp. 3-1Str]MDR8414080.1 hypothetical protein [Nonomuraea sp. 3-1Str]